MLRGLRATLCLLVVASALGRVTEREKATKWEPPKYSQTERADNLDAEIASRAVDPWKAKERSKKSGRPVLVLVTKPGCGACTVLKGQMNTDAEFKALLDKFTFVHAQLEDETAMAYVKKLIKPLPVGTSVPQTIFVAPGAAGVLDVTSSHPNHKHFFGSSRSLTSAMHQALEQSSHRKQATQQAWRDEIRRLHEGRPDVDVEELIAQNEGKLLSLLKRVRAEFSPADEQAKQASEPCAAAEETCASSTAVAADDKEEL